MNKTIATALAVGALAFNGVTHAPPASSTPNGVVNSYYYTHWIHPRNNGNHAILANGMLKVEFHCVGYTVDAVYVLTDTEEFRESVMGPDIIWHRDGAYRIHWGSCGSSNPTTVTQNWYAIWLEGPMEATAVVK